MSYLVHIHLCPIFQATRVVKFCQFSRQDLTEYSSMCKFTFELLPSSKKL
jgi:hypothetical protein